MKTADNDPPVILHATKHSHKQQRCQCFHFRQTLQPCQRRIKTAAAFVLSDIQFTQDQTPAIHHTHTSSKNKNKSRAIKARQVKSAEKLASLSTVDANKNSLK